jgi:hypothetical protein
MPHYADQLFTQLADELELLRLEALHAGYWLEAPGSPLAALAARLWCTLLPGGDLAHPDRHGAAASAAARQIYALATGNVDPPELGISAPGPRFVLSSSANALIATEELLAAHMAVLARFGRKETMAYLACALSPGHDDPRFAAALDLIEAHLEC